MKVRQQFRI